MMGYSLLYLNTTTNAINTYKAGVMLASGRAPKFQSHSHIFRNVLVFLRDQNIDQMTS